MTYLYNNLLDPDLYCDQPHVARFVEMLLEPEIEANAAEQVRKISREMMPMDDINGLVEPLSLCAKQQITQTGSLTPEFNAFLDADYKIRLGIGDELPRTRRKVDEFLYAGKALAFVRVAQCIFFSTMQPLVNDMPAFGESVSESAPWGIIIIGSSLRGNCFILLMEITRNKDNIRFNTIHHKILREGQYDYPYSRFFHIEDEDEMGGIIRQIPKLMIRCQLSEEECVQNFASCLMILRQLGYQKT